MKVLEKNFKKGYVKLIPKTLDDLWHLYNIIYKGDTVYSRTTRELKIDTEYSRPQKGKRVSTFLGVTVEEVVWDRSLNRLRIHGQIHEAPENIAGKGSHHTLNVPINKPLTIIKERWAKHQIDRLWRAERHETPPIIVLSIDSEEYCIALIRQYGIDIKVEGKAELPGKLEAEKRVDALKKYFKETLNSLMQIWLPLKCSIVIIGVGFTKTKFSKHLKENPTISQSLADVKGVNNGGVAGIKEALRSGILETTLQSLRIAEEAKAVEEILERLGKEDNKVTYGLEQTETANSLGAIEKLMILDYTIRSTLDEERLKLEKLMTEVEMRKGQVIIISVEHEAGKKLLALGGVAALLRFPIT
jgi:protein pelota